MSKQRVFRVLVVVPGSDPAAVREAVTAMVTSERIPVDELHVLVPAADAVRVRSALLETESRVSLTAVCAPAGIEQSATLFGGRTIHGLGLSDRAVHAASLADGALETLRRVCSDERNEVTVVCQSGAGALGILTHSALQLVGRPNDRFFVLEYGSGSSPEPLLLELPMVLAEESLSASQRYLDLAVSRRLGRRRLSEPGVLWLDGHRRVLRIDDLDVVLPRLQFFWMFSLATLAPHPFPLRVVSGNFHVSGRGEIIVAPEHPRRNDIEAAVGYLRRIFSTLFPESTTDFALMFKRACGPSPGLPSVIAKLNATLRRSLGIGAAPYLIAGGRGNAGYRLTLPSNRIKIDPRVSPPDAKATSPLLG
jgi:hypothetical protein